MDNNDKIELIDFVIDNYLQQSSKEELQSDLQAHWDFEVAPFPIPKFEQACPCCGGSRILFRRAQFHHRKTGTSHPYRCDVHFKCRACSFAWLFGVVVPKENYVKTNKIVYEWRDIQKYLVVHQLFLKDSLRPGSSEE